MSPSVLQTPSLITYGYHPAAEWRAEQVEPNGKGGLTFTAVHHGAEAGRFALSVPGRHNVSNTLAALATSHLLGLDITTLAPAVEAFKGVARRFQIIAEAGDVVVIDDYGHHPTEVRATLAAARLRYPGRRIRCVFQPHTYSRTKLLLPEFVDAFSDADEVATTDIYAAREEPVWDITGEQFASALNHQRATFTPTLTAATEWVLADLRPGDVVLAMGAGDIYKVGAGVAEAVRAKYGA